MVVNLFILKSNIKSEKMVRALSPLLGKDPLIGRWSVDTEDIDHVLRIETLQKSSESEIIRRIRSYGVHCETLPD